MKQYMLDTNTVSYLIKSNAQVIAHLLAVPITSICISAITEGELLFGIAKRPQAKKLHLAVQEFLKRVDVIAWESATAQHYGSLRADLERQGKTLAPLDTLIAAHALSINATLVTNDRAFSAATNLVIENWCD
ncbi:MAG: type II toxin-antitoxin system VapC family toxin [Methylophilaceae bacterium]|nr:type II toxin-antitoxin system VapC family toxin [Methylophilaceae bacterium]